MDVSMKPMDILATINSIAEQIPEDPNDEMGAPPPEGYSEPTTNILTVGDLIRELSRFPPEMTAYIMDSPAAGDYMFGIMAVDEYDDAVIIVKTDEPL